MIKVLLLGGTILMILGFVQGFTLGLVPNYSLALAAHVSAIQNGLILLVLAGVWQFANLQKLSTLTVWLCVIGLYELWLGLFVAASLGLSSPMDSPITKLFQFSGSAALLVGFVFLLFGFFKGKGGNDKSITL